MKLFIIFGLSINKKKREREGGRELKFCFLFSFFDFGAVAGGLNCASAPRVIYRMTDVEHVSLPTRREPRNPNDNKSEAHNETVICYFCPKPK